MCVPPGSRLDPSEEQLDIPAALVEGGNLACRRIEAVAHGPQHRPGLIATLICRTAWVIKLHRDLTSRAGREPMWSEITPSARCGTDRVSMASNCVFAFSPEVYISRGHPRPL